MTFTRLPKLYAILDGESVRAAGLDILDAARSLRDAGILLLQYRDKSLSKMEILRNARAIRSIFKESKATLFLNDWPQIAVEARWDGVHVGQSDMAVSDARKVIGVKRQIGVSTHTPEQFRSVLATDADYVAYGPIFRTSTKLDAEATVGLEGLRQVRELSNRPLVAIGGVSFDGIESVFAAGADSVAVAGALFQGGQSVLTAACRLLQRVNDSC